MKFESTRSKNLGAAAAAALALVGVSGLAASAAAATKAQYIPKADAICRASETRVKPLEAQYKKAIAQNTTTGFKEGARILNRVASLDSSGLAKVRAMPKPAGDGKAINKIWAASEKNVSTTRRAATALSQQNATAIKADAAALKQSTAKYKQLARAFGFKVCGQA
jgi:hypothetical protein